MAVLFIASGLCGCGDDESTSTANAQVEVFDASEPRFGRTYDEWTVEWWRWYFRAPGSEHPALDTTGDDCLVEQDPDSPVFFLLATNGGAVSRTCSFPADKAILFPLLTLTLDYVGASEIGEVDALVGQATEWKERIVDGSLEAVVDGQDILSGTYDQAAVEYTYEVPPGDNIYAAVGFEGVEGTIDPAVLVGVWAFVAPLPSGEHQIHFGGRVGGETAFDTSADYTVNLQ